MIRVNRTETMSWSPGLTPEKLLEERGLNQSQVTFIVNGHVVPKASYDSYEVPDDSEVNVFPLSHGG